MEKKEYSKEFCKYNFTEEELKDLAGQMAMKTQELDTIEIEKKSAMSSFKDRLDGANLELKSCAGKYKDSYEMRNIECEVIRDFDDGVVRFIRTDTGECVRVKKMTNEEKQMHIDDALPKEDSKKEKSNAEIAADNSTKRAMTSETSAL